MEPGFPDDNNAEEAYNNNFKEDGTGRKQHHITGAGGFIEVWGNFVHRDSKSDVEFTMHPIIECNDWREAQNTMSKDNIGLYIMQTNITVHGVSKNVLIIPSTKTVKAVEMSTRDSTERKTKITEVMKCFVKVYRKGLSEATLGSLPTELGFDKVLEVLHSAYVLFLLDVPEPEIKYQCSCPGF